MNRNRPALRALSAASLLLLAWAAGSPAGAQGARSATRPPNVLIAISDDQSYPHASAYGSRTVRTPGFDRVAREGVLFRNGFVASPGCSPSRAALLTGRQPWQIEQAGTHDSNFPLKYVVFPDLLEQAGYLVGQTGKGWGPGNWEASGRTRNPAGTAFQKAQTTAPTTGISRNDYAGNFQQFLQQRKPGQPFYFWFGASEPHRVFEEGSGRRAGKKLHEAEVPPFLPDAPEIRSDILDYALEIEWHDSHLERMLKMLDAAGELDNTIVIVTADNGMSFPRAKANAYEYGIHVPLAIRWGRGARGGRAVDDLVSLVDLAPTILEAAGVKHTGAYPMTGRSIMNILASTQQGVVDPSRDAVFSGRERHSSSRYDNQTYPQRAVRTQQYLYIRNFKPERWPAGDPQKLEADGKLGPMHGGYHDIDAAPSLTYLVEERDAPSVRRFFHLAVDKRPAEELYDIRSDPGCLINLAGAPGYGPVMKELSARLTAHLTQTQDPRILGNGDVWETYPRYSEVRKFPAPQ